MELHKFTDYQGGEKISFHLNNTEQRSALFCDVMTTRESTMVSVYVCVCVCVCVYVCVCICAHV